jgi:two-component SAPR family response regulator
MVSFAFQLLGEFSINESTKHLALPTFRNHNLLFALLLRPGLKQRQQWVGLLYPDQPKARGRRWLSDTIYLLRKSIPRWPLDTNPYSVSLPVENRWLDVERFIKAVKLNNLASWLKAVNLYQGELLADNYHEWLIEHRDAKTIEYLHINNKAAKSFSKVDIPAPKQCSKKAVTILSQAGFLLDNIGVDVFIVYKAVFRAVGDNEQTWVLIERALKTLINEKTEIMDQFARQARFRRNQIYRSLLKGKTGPN